MSSSECNPALTLCPPGHQMWECSDGFRCEQCAGRTFQPNQNRFSEKCRLRKNCERKNMDYKKTSKGGYMYGSTTEDAVCVCIKGYSFQARVQRECVPNHFCPKGFGVNQFGLCEDCHKKTMFSDTHDNVQQCQPLRNCEKDGRCTIKKSNGTADNECGPLVKDVNYCDSITFDRIDTNGDQGSNNNINIIIWASIGAVAFVAVIVMAVILAIIFTRRSRRRKEQPLTQNQLEDIKLRMMERVDKDDAFICTVLSTSFRVIEDRIDKQIWSFAQELFREHPITGKYEIVVENYKNTEHKYAINSYLKDWKSWRGDGSESVHILVDCLQRNKREDIVLEICSRLKSEMGVVQTYSGQKDRSSKSGKSSDFLSIIFPCLNNDGETITIVHERNTKLMLHQDSSHDLHPGTQSPSAPPLNETTSVQYPMSSKDYSIPIQASS